MLCDNCGKKEANIRYSENINGKKKELYLCEECSQKLGISSKMDFSIPINFSSFFGGFMDNMLEPEIFSTLDNFKTLKCDNCGTTFETIANTGKLGCSNCYDVFESKLEPIIKKIQGANQHIGRTGKVLEKKIGNIEQKNQSKKQGKSKKEQLQEELKQAIKEERYEDAAKIRDELKKY